MLRVQRKEMLEQRRRKRSELGKRKGSVYVDACREWLKNSVRCEKNWI